MLNRRLLFAILFVSLIVAGCRNTPEVTAENLQIALEINPGPTHRWRRHFIDYADG